MNILSAEAVKEKLNGKTAIALLNERTNPIYNETNSGNQFSCVVRILNYENQSCEFSGYGLVDKKDQILFMI